MKRLFVWTASLVALTLVATGCSLGSGKSSAAPSVQPVTVAVREARQGTLTATYTASGVIEPKMSVTITAKVPGRVLTVHKEIGDRVKEGELLLELDDRDAAAQLAQAKANLAQAEAQRLEAQRQLNRLSTLWNAGAVSRQQVEQVETQLSLASAQVEAARAALELATANWERTRITAPADGTLAARYIEPGAMVSVGTPVFQLVDLSSVVVKAGVAEGEVNAIRPGTTVPVRVTALAQKFTGTVTAVSPNMDRQTRSYQVRVTLDNPDGVLKGGMYAEVQFPLRDQKGILIPVTAVVNRGTDAYVYIVEESKARQQPVTILVKSEDMVAVEGVKAGDKVVVAGQNRLYDGAPVKVGRSMTP